MMWAPFLRFLTLATLLSQVLATCLGVTRDLFDNKGAAIPNDQTSLMSYSSMLALDTPTTVEGATDGNLIWLAKTGYDEMVNAYKIIETKKLKGFSAPSAMVVLAPGGTSTIFLGSSLRNIGGDKNGFYGDGTVGKYLKRCLEDKQEHKADGKCGEFNTLQEFFDRNGPNKPLPPNSRIVAWVKTAQKEGVTPPCWTDKPERSGCRELLADVGKGNIKAIEGGAPIEPTGWKYVSSNGRNTRHGGSGSSS